MDKLLGKVLKHDVISKAGLLLVPARTKLTWGHIKLLQQHRVSSADLMYASEALPTVAESLVAEASQYAEDLFYRIRRNRKVPLLEIRTELIPYIQQITEHPNLFEVLDSVKVKDQYTYKHSVGVGVLATLLGKWLKLDKAELAVLSLGATLHDVGKMRISQEILQKPDKLSEEEFSEVKRHTIYGYEMLKEALGINPRIPLIALQHHERVCGAGYPLQLKDPQIDDLSRIVAVADVFHAMTSTRPYQEAAPFHEVIDQLLDRTGNILDPYVVNVFLQNIAAGMVGRKVLLNDGQWGEVIYINPHDYLKPLVRINESFVDLSRERNVRICEIIA
ncbi:HD-GYP domain-containing protein [Paenibacillus athensensis]|uniref:HD-GYP domain-containing protein n=2 Tax=Paenibacillus athensensis TaxID=1967502 RepID=A0A4Y8Q4S4_9BACL|nr:HD-GYP domain-containing protein [Paenibacillus athensensis]